MSELASGGGEGYAVRDGDASSFSFQETKRLFELTGGQSTGGPGRRFQVPHLQKGPQRNTHPRSAAPGVCFAERAENDYDKAGCFEAVFRL